jgi:hypothetical protein
VVLLGTQRDVDPPRSGPNHGSTNRVLLRLCRMFLDIDRNLDGFERSPRQIAMNANVRPNVNQRVAHGDLLLQVRRERRYEDMKRAFGGRRQGQTTAELGHHRTTDKDSSSLVARPRWRKRIPGCGCPAQYWLRRRRTATRTGATTAARDRKNRCGQHDHANDRMPSAHSDPACPHQRQP